MVSSDEDIQNFAYEGRDTSWKVVFPNRAETGGRPSEMRGSMSLEADINDMILKLPHGRSVGFIENGRGEFSDGAMQEDLTSHFLFSFSFCFSFTLSFPLSFSCISFFQD